MKPRLFKPLIFANKNLNPDRIGLEDLSPLAVTILALFLSAFCFLPSAFAITTSTQIVASITITNLTGITNGATFTVNGAARTWTNEASGLVEGIELYATNSWTMFAFALNNYVSTTNAQTVGNKFITNSTLLNPSLTNAFLTNASLLSPFTTNLVNWGNAIRSEC